MVVLGVIVMAIIGIQQSFFEPEIQNFVQFVGRPVCGASFCAGYRADILYSATASIDTGKNVFRFEAKKFDVEKRKVCKTLPSGVENVVELGEDLEGCMHWSFDEVQYRDVYVADGSVNNVICNDPSYTGVICTTSCAGHSICQNNGFCYSPGSQGWKSCFKEEISRTTTSDYGGITIATSDADGNIYYGCYQEVDVYRNDVLVDTIYSNFGSRSKAYYDDGTISNNLYLDRSGVYVSTQETSWWNYPTCSAIQNSYSLLFPDDSFDLQISQSDSSYTQGEIIELFFDVENRLTPVSASLATEYEVPSIIGTAKKTVVKNVSLALGNNRFTYSIPTDEPVRLLRVRPGITVYFPTSKVSGLNYAINGKTLPASTVETINLGTQVGEWNEVLINPKPIYYEKTSDPCIEGYSVSKDGNFCLSDEISGLSCVQTGCPGGYEPPYQCTSSGFCAQQVYVAMACASDTDCPESTRCDTPTGYCINEVVFEKVVQCSLASDCLTPCEGMTASCTDNQCSYSGSCGYQQCSQASDCPSSPCEGLTYSCEANKCVSEGQCIPDSQEKSFWELIAEIWHRFVQWVVSLFGG